MYEEIKSPIQVINIGLTKDMIVPEDIGHQNEIPKIEIPSFYANKRITGISTNYHTGICKQLFKWKSYMELLR